MVDEAYADPDGWTRKAFRTIAEYAADNWQVEPRPVPCWHPRSCMA
jgi:hypothetical protein